MAKDGFLNRGPITMGSPDHTMPETSPETASRQDRSMSMGRVNLVAIPFALLPPLLPVTLFVWVWGLHPLAAPIRHPFALLIFGAVFLAGVTLHELIHGVAWKWASRKPWSTISFGFNVASLTPYAHCSEPMNARAYRVGALAPALLLGFLPATAGLLSGNPWTFLYGILFIVAAAGDFLILWLLRGVPADRLVEDHPTRAGCYVYE
jgi:hypothetical protein